jgi:hypothetical protein
MSKISGLTLEQALELFKNKDTKILYTSRGNGRINPLSMKIMTFKEALDFAKLRKWSYTYAGVTKECFYLYGLGLYIVNDDGTLSNVNRMVTRLVKAGLLREGEEGFVTTV